MKTLVRFVSLLLSVCMLLTIGAAFAEESNGFGSRKQPNAFGQGEFPKGMPNFKGENGERNFPAKPDGENGMPKFGGKFGNQKLKDMLENGSISQETYDAIAAYAQENRPEKQGEQGDKKFANGDFAQTPIREAIDKLYADAVITEDAYNALSEMFEKEQATEQTEE